MATFQFTLLASGKVLMKDGATVVQGFPSEVYLTADTRDPDIIKIDSDPGLGRGMKMYEFKASTITVPAHSGRDDLMTKLLTDFFKGATISVDTTGLATEDKQDDQITNQGAAGTAAPFGTGILGWLRGIYDKLTQFSFTGGALDVNASIDTTGLATEANQGTETITPPSGTKMLGWLQGIWAALTGTLDVNITSAVTGKTILTDGDIDLGRPGFSGFNTLKVASETQIFEEGWSDGIDTDEIWTLTEVGTGTVVVADSQGTFTTLASGDEATIQTKLPHLFFHGFSTLWRIAVHTDSATITNGFQLFGPIDDDNGYAFRIGTNGLDCIIRRKTIDTVINIAGFTSGRHGYAIQYLDGNQVRFYLDNVLLHTAISGSENLIAKSNLPTTISVEQTGAGGSSVLTAFGLAVIREGAPLQFNETGQLSVTFGGIVTPQGADKVIRPTTDSFIVLGPNDVVDDFYTITNGKSLVLQQLRGRVESAGVGKGVRIELFSDPLADNPSGPADDQPASWIRIDTLMGNNFNQDAIQGITLTGDGTARVVLRLHQVGSDTVATVGAWRGYEI